MVKESAFEQKIKSGIELETKHDPQTVACGFAVFNLSKLWVGADFVDSAGKKTSGGFSIEPPAFSPVQIVIVNKNNVFDVREDKDFPPKDTLTVEDISHMLKQMKNHVLSGLS